MNQARILLLGGNYLPEPTGIGKYNGEMMHWLAGEGFECGVVTSYPYYPHWKIQSPYERKSYWFSKETVSTEDKDIKVYRCPHYIPQKPSGLKRMVSDLSFFISAFFQVFMLLFTKKYDYIIAVVPPFQLGLLGMFYRFFKGGKLIYHIQDLQIDAAKELKMIKSNALLNIMFSVEKLILKKSDFVSTISDGMMSRVMKKVNKPVIFFPNWCDTTSFHPLTNKEELKAKFDLDPSRKVVLYSGAIGEKQGLEAVIHAAKALVDQNIQFVICGSGPYKEKLIKLVEKLGVTNLTFMPLQPKEKFNDFLNMADLHLVLQKANANDLVMPSKLTTILSIGGLSLVTATQKTSLHSILTRHDMGILVEPENDQLLIEAISNAMQHSYAGMKENARTFALEYLTMHSVIDRFLGDIMPERAQLKVPLATITTTTQVKEEPAESSDMMSYTTGQ